MLHLGLTTGVTRANRLKEIFLKEQNQPAVQFISHYVETSKVSFTHF